MTILRGEEWSGPWSCPLAPKPFSASAPEAHARKRLRSPWREDGGMLRPAVIDETVSLLPGADCRYKAARVAGQGAGRSRRRGASPPRQGDVMMVNRKIPLRLVWGLALAIVLDTLVQVSWKAAVSTLPPASSAWGTSMAVLDRPIFLGVAFLLACQLFNWLKVLDHADLSYAQPITSLSYVSVCLCSVFYLNEPIDLLQIVGIGCILAGVWFISRTDPVTAPGSEPGR